MDNSYMESVWHIFKRMHDAGLIYEVWEEERIPLSRLYANINDLKKHIESNPNKSYLLLQIEGETVNLEQI